MPSSVAIQESVGNITAMLVCCAVIFAVLVGRVLGKFNRDAWEATGAKTQEDKDSASLKLVAIMMAVPLVAFLGVMVGEFPTLWRAFPSWCIFIILLILALAVLIIALFLLDREDMEDYTLEFSQRNFIDKRMKKQDAEKKIVLQGFGLWIIALGASYLWLLHSASISLKDILQWF